MADDLIPNVPDTPSTPQGQVPESIIEKSVNESKLPDFKFTPPPPPPPPKTDE